MAKAFQKIYTQITARYRQRQTRTGSKNHR